jgi:co-chaperonin GroES (HSP10)
MSGTDEYRYANVVKTGPGLFTQTGDRIPMAVHIGDEIMIHSNQIGDHKEISIDGEKYHLVRESEIALIKQQ